MGKIRCRSCGAILMDGKPQYDDKTMQRYKCTMYWINKDMVKIKTIQERRK